MATDTIKKLLGETDERQDLEKLARKCFVDRNGGEIAKRTRDTDPQLYAKVADVGYEIGVCGKRTWLTPQEREANYVRRLEKPAYSEEQLAARKLFPIEKVTSLFKENGTFEVDGKHFTLGQLKEKYPPLAEKARTSAASFGLVAERPNPKPEPRVEQPSENRVKLAEDVAKFHGLEAGATVPASAVPALLREMSETARIAAVDKAVEADKTLQAARKLHDQYAARIREAEALAAKAGDTK